MNRLTRFSKAIASEAALPTSLPTVIGYGRIARRAMTGWGRVSENTFKDQVNRILAAGGQFVGLDAFVDRFESPGPGDHREFLLVFEDATYDLLDRAWPWLQAWGLPGVVFVRTASVGRYETSRMPGRTRTQFLSWSDLAHLQAAGVSVESEGHHGVDGSRVQPEVFYGDLIRSRRELERRLGRLPDAFRYVGGVRPNTQHLVEQAGYRVAFGRQAGHQHRFDVAYVGGGRGFLRRAHAASL